MESFFLLTRLRGESGVLVIKPTTFVLIFLHSRSDRDGEKALEKNPSVWCLLNIDFSHFCLRLSGEDFVLGI